MADTEKPKVPGAFGIHDGADGSWSDTLDRDLDRREEAGTFGIRWGADFGFGPARHDRTVHRRGSSGKSEVGGQMGGLFLCQQPLSD